MEGDLASDYSSFGLQDKIAIVTGPSQGIGRAIAIGLAQAGAHLVLAKHPANRQEEVRQRVVYDAVRADTHTHVVLSDNPSVNRTILNVLSESYAGRSAT